MKHSPSSHPSINIIHHEDDIFHPSIDSKPHLSIKCHLLMGMKLIFIHPWRGTEAKLLAARPACEALLLCLLRRLMFSAPEQIWLLELERELLLISISYSIARERERRMWVTEHCDWCPEVQVLCLLCRSFSRIPYREFFWRIDVVGEA